MAAIPAVILEVYTRGYEALGFSGLLGLLAIGGWQLAELFEKKCRDCVHKTCLFLGVYPSFGAEQISYPFPGEQADPGAKRLFHRNKFKDLYGECVHPTDIHTAYGLCNLTKWLHVPLEWGEFEVSVSTPQKKSHSFPSPLTHSDWYQKLVSCAWPQLKQGCRKRSSSESTVDPGVLSKGFASFAEQWEYTKSVENKTYQWPCIYKAVKENGLDNVWTLALCPNYVLAL